MKFMHLSDLHLGKRINEFSMLEDQEYILKKILQIIDETSVDSILIAGDIYDKPVPSAEAVQLCDDFLYELSRRRLQVFVISGNHDSPERIAFGSRLMDRSGIHMSPVYQGVVERIRVDDEYGAVNVYMLPFVKPALVRRFYQEEEIETYTQAVEVVVRDMQVQQEQRNIIVAHQFVTGAWRSDSEEISVGGLDNVDASVFAPFDYVALGHIHGSQKIGRDTVRYCGTPLKYSFSEANHTKSVTIVTMKEKGEIAVDTVPLTPKHDLREIRGSYMEITAKSFYEGTETDDYMHITLTDEEDIPDAIGRLRVIYPNLMRLDYDNKRTRSGARCLDIDETEAKTPMELFAEFYEKQNNQSLSEIQKNYVKELMERIWEGEL